MKEKKGQNEVSDEDFFLLVKVLIRALKAAAWLLERFIGRTGREALRREIEEERKRQSENKPRYEERK